MRNAANLHFVLFGLILASAIMLQGCAGEEEAPTPAPVPKAEPCVQQASRQAEQIDHEMAPTETEEKEPVLAASVDSKKSASSDSSSSSSSVSSSSSSSSSASSDSSSSSSASSDSSSSGSASGALNINVAAQSASSSQSARKTQTKTRRHVTYTVTRTETLEHLKEEVAHEAQMESAAITMEAASTAALDKKLGEEATRTDRLTKIAQEEDEARKLELLTLDSEMNDMNKKLLQDEKERNDLQAQLEKAKAEKIKADNNQADAEEKEKDVLARIANNKAHVTDGAEDRSQDLQGVMAREPGKKGTSLVQATELLGAFAIAGKSLLQEASQERSSRYSSKEVQTNEAKTDPKNREDKFAVEVQQHRGTDSFVALKSKEQAGPRARRAALQEK